MRLGILVGRYKGVPYYVSKGEILCVIDWVMHRFPTINAMKMALDGGLI